LNRDYQHILKERIHEKICEKNYRYICDYIALFWYDWLLALAKSRRRWRMQYTWL